MNNYNESAAHKIEDVINDTSFSPTEQAYNFAIHAHRYLQSQMTKFCIEYLFMLGEMHETGQFDERNEIAVNLGDELLKLATIASHQQPETYRHITAAFHRHVGNVSGKKVENKFGL